MKKIAIHQPNFFPWLGYFFKIYLSDSFVFLDDAQIQKTGSNYTNRTQILCLNGRSVYLTVPIRRRSGTQKICDVEIDKVDWRRKFCATIHSNYSKSRFYKKNSDLIFELAHTQTSKLSELNQSISIRLYNELNLRQVEFIKASDLSVDEHSTQRLISVVKSLAGDIYLSGKGGAKYQDESLFLREKIILKYIEYPEFLYPQVVKGEFVSGLSILDAVFNIDFSGIRDFFMKNILART